MIDFGSKTISISSYRNLIALINIRIRTSPYLKRTIKVKLAVVVLLYTTI